MVAFIGLSKIYPDWCNTIANGGIKPAKGSEDSQYCRIVTKSFFTIIFEVIFVQVVESLVGLTPFMG